MDATSTPALPDETTVVESHPTLNLPDDAAGKSSGEESLSEYINVLLAKKKSMNKTRRRQKSRPGAASPTQIDSPVDEDEKKVTDVPRYFRREDSLVQKAIRSVQAAKAREAEAQDVERHEVSDTPVVFRQNNSKKSYEAEPEESVERQVEEGIEERLLAAGNRNRRYR